VGAALFVSAKGVAAAILKSSRTVPKRKIDFFIMALP
jgi:hypothetical protein